MKIKDFIVTDLNFLITDLEISRTSDAEISLMTKILKKIRFRMSKSEKGLYKQKIKDLENRLTKIETVDKEIAFKLAELKDIQDVLKLKDKMRKDGN